MAHSTDTKAQQAEVLAILLASDSPARKLKDFTGLFTQLEDLTQQQKDVEAREQLLQSVLPTLEEAERTVADAEKQLAQEKSTLADYAGELGKAAFDALRAGEITDGAIFADRKELQGRIDDLQKRKQALGASQQSSVLEKAKTQAQILALTGQLKLEEFKVGAANKALGAALLASKNLAPVRCSSTEPLLKAIVQQNKRVNASTTQLKEATDSSSKCSEEVAKQIDYSGSLTADALRSEIAAARKQISACGKALGTTHREMLLKAMASDQLKAKIPALCHLEVAQEASPVMAERIKQLSEDVSKNVLKHRSHPWARYSLVGISLLILLAASFALRSGARQEQATGTSGTTATDSERDTALTTLRSQGGTAKQLDDGTYEIWLKNSPHPTASEIDAVETLGAVSTLDLSYSSVSTSDLRRIGKLSSLRRLFLMKTEVTDEAVAALSGLKALELLRLDFTAITDRALGHVAQLENLKELTLSGTRITDLGLRQLRPLKKLTVLGIATTSASRPGVYGMPGDPTVRELFDSLDQPTSKAIRPTGGHSDDKQWPETFEYAVRGKRYQGRCEGDETNALSRGKEIVIYAAEGIKSGNAVRVTFIDSIGESLVSTSILGFEDNKLVARPGLGGMWLNIMFIVKKPEGELKALKTKMLTAPATGATVSATCFDPDNGYQGPFFFGKRASTVPKRDQKLVFVDTGATFGSLDLGEPTKVVNQGPKDVLDYWELNPGNLYFFCDKISKPGKPLVLEAGGKRWSIDESALHTLRLLASAVAHLRHSVGYTKESDATLGD